MNYREQFKQEKGYKVYYDACSTEYIKWLESKLSTKEAIIKAQEEYIKFLKPFTYFSGRHIKKADKLINKIKSLKGEK